MEIRKFIRTLENRGENTLKTLERIDVTSRTGTEITEEKKIIET